jgi:RES domain-containing protein
VIVTAYRITRKAYAAAIWSGMGAREYGGRWTPKGLAVVYTAGNRSLAAIEQLVHLVSPRILNGFVIASITFDDANVQRVDPQKLPRGWNHPVAPPGVRRLGEAWFKSGKYAVLAVPSAVIPGEWNFLFNSAHRRFADFERQTPEPFVYDRRLR